MRSDYITPAQLAELLKNLTPDNRLVCQVCAVTGLRVGDVLRLKRDQVWGPQPMEVEEHKTHKTRRVRLPAELLDRLRLRAGPVWVFPGRDPERPRTRQAVWRDVKTQARRLGLPQNVSPHSLRKYYAVAEMRRRHGNLEAVQRDLNHRWPSTTMIYVGSAALYQATFGGQDGGRGPPG